MRHLILSFLIVSFPLYLFAQNTETSPDSLFNNSPFEAVSDTIPDLNIFENEEPLNITLKYDITSFIRHKMKGEYQEAVLEIHYDNEQIITKNIRLKARGNYRRENCFFPPIHLNFKTDPIEGTDLTRKIKLVTHCSGSKKAENYILREYLAYKMYNILSEHSFKVRLLNIKYLDTGKKGRNYESVGFLIEPLAFLSEREGAITVEPTIIRYNNITQKDGDILALFQYMIGNTDWRIKGGHNTKYIKPLDMVTDKVVPVPYDFDFSGFVGTSYSFPQTWTSIDNVKQREYLGYCRENENDYTQNIGHFISKKEEVLNLLHDFELLNDKYKKESIKYIDDFYESLNKPQVLVRKLKNQCRTEF